MIDLASVVLFDEFDAQMDIKYWTWPAAQEISRLMGDPKMFISEEFDEFKDWILE